jgi:DNA-directed RNA polymerase specialized sigma24 family protein
MSPQLLEAVSNAFTQDESEGSIVRDEAGALRQCLAGLPTDKRELIAIRT